MLTAVGLGLLIGVGYPVALVWIFKRIETLNHATTR